MIVREWAPGGSFEVAEKRTWRGIRLVCCTPHVAGDKAVHPWDPGAGWEAERQAALWAPEGEVETAKLAEASKAWEGRLRVCALLACGRRKRPA